MKNSRCGWAFAGVADDDRAEEPLVERQGIHRAVVVVHPGALALGDRLPGVVEGVALLDEAAGVGVLPLVGAVHVARVLHPVRVDRHRRLDLVLEVDDDRVADVRLDQRPGNRRRPERLGEAGGVGAVRVGLELRLPADLLAHHLVALVRDDVPVHGLGLDPVLAPAGHVSGQNRLRGLPESALALLRRGDLGRDRHLGREALDVGAPVGEDLLPGEGAEEDPAGVGDECASSERAHRPVQTDPRPRGYFFTLTVIFITSGWIVQRKS